MVINHKLIITKHKDTVISAFFEGTDMVQVSLNPAKEDDILGNIYLGKVKNIVKNINAAFVEIADGRICYYSMTENRYPILANQNEQDIEDKPKEVKIKIGDELIVQVTKEDVKTKAPVVSSNINLTGKYVALTYGKSSVGISKKIVDVNERQRLKKLVKPYVCNEYGFVVRTNSAYVQDELIIKEINNLIDIYTNIRTYGVHKSRYSLLYRTPPGYICDIRDGYSDQVDEFVTDDTGLYENMMEYLEKHQPEDKEKLRFIRIAP